MLQPIKCAWRAALEWPGRAGSRSAVVRLRSLKCQPAAGELRRHLETPFTGQIEGGVVVLDQIEPPLAREWIRPRAPELPARWGR